jgi:hypothetical protein
VKPALEQWPPIFNVDPIIGSHATVERVGKAMESADMAFLATYGLSPANMPSGEGAIVLTNGLLTSERSRSLRFQKKSVIVLSATISGAWTCLDSRSSATTAEPPRP